LSKDKQTESSSGLQLEVTVNWQEITALQHIHCVTSSKFRLDRASYCSFTFTLYLSLCRFNGHFPGEPGLAGVYWSKGWWKWWWQLDTGAISGAKLQSNHHHEQASFLQAGCPSTVSKHILIILGHGLMGVHMHPPHYLHSLVFSF